MENFIDPEALHFIPLGGSEQFGVNLNVYAYKGKYLIADCGVGFADERFPGIDLLLPDPSFLVENAENIEAMIITHAHEDHVGAVPHLWKKLKCPVYGSAFTASVLQRKLKEFGIQRDVNLQVLRPGKDGYKHLGVFKVKPVHVAHSVPDSKSLIIEAGDTRVVHSGDWHLDPAPIIGEPTDEKTFKAMGELGVHAYIGDSTNANLPGRAGTESEVEKGLEAVFHECHGRIIITMFASNVGRVVSIAKAAKETGRTVAIVGRSLVSMLDSARDCGYLNGVPEIYSIDEIDDIPYENLVIIVTGSQGEGRAALARIARGDMRDVKLGKGDTVIFSAKAIPGNEKDINHVQNNIVSSGAKVITAKGSPHNIHISGHPYIDEVLDMYSWVRPKVVIPVHGERFQIEAQAELAREHSDEFGIQDVVVPKNGSVIKITKDGAEIVGEVNTNILAVEQKAIISASHPSISARRKLQFSGVVHATVLLNSQGEVCEGSLVSVDGLPYSPEDNDDIALEDMLMDEIIDIIDDMSWEDLQNESLVSEEVRIGVRRFCVHLMGIKPKTTVHLIRL